MNAWNNNCGARNAVWTAALTLSLTALAGGIAHAQDPGQGAPPPAPAPVDTSTPQGSANGPSSLGLGGVQGRPEGGQGENSGGGQVQGTPTGAAAQGNSAGGTGAPVPSAENGGGRARPTAIPPAGAGSYGMGGDTSGSARMQVTTSTALSPILVRARDMLSVAQARQAAAPSGARQPYRDAAQAFRQMLSMAGYSTSGSSALPPLGSGMSSRGASASLSSFPVASEQVTDDIRVLRMMARQGKSSRAGTRAAGPALSAATMQKVASLYATGAKQFFTGQLRDALLESPVRVSLRSSGSRVVGSMASDGMSDEAAASGAARVRSDRPSTPFIVHLANPDGSQQTGSIAAPPSDGTSTAGSSALPGPFVAPPGGNFNNFGVPGGSLPVPPTMRFAPNGPYGPFGSNPFVPQVLIQGAFGPATGFYGAPGVAPTGPVLLP